MPPLGLTIRNPFEGLQGRNLTIQNAMGAPTVTPLGVSYPEEDIPFEQDAPHIGNPGAIPYLPPPTSGPFAMPERRDLDSLTSFRGVLEDPRFSGIVNDALTQGGLSPWAQVLQAGIRPLAGNRGRIGFAIQDAMDMRRKNAMEQLNNLAKIVAESEMGRERNTAAYGNIEDAYRKERMAPYQERSEYQAGTHQEQLAEQARQAAAKSLEEAATESQMRQPKLDKIGEQIKTQQQTTAIRGAEAANAGEYYRNRADAEARKAHPEKYPSKPGTIPKVVQDHFKEYESLLLHGQTSDGKDILDVQILGADGKPIEITEPGKLWGTNVDAESTRQAKLNFIRTLRDNLVKQYPQLTGSGQSTIQAPSAAGTDPDREEAIATAMQEGLTREQAEQVIDKYKE